jgi:hypothetical protein
MLNKKGVSVIPIALLDVILSAIMLVAGFTMTTFAIAGIESQNEVITDNLEYKILANRLLTNCIALTDTTSGFRPGFVDAAKLNKFSYDSCFGPDVEYTVAVYDRFSDTPNSAISVSTGGLKITKDAFPVIIVDRVSGSRPANIVVELGFT